MAQPVTLLRPRVRPFEDAVDAYRKGDSAGCIDALHAHTSVGSALLYMRAAIRVGDLGSAIEAGDRIDRTDLTGAQRAEVLSLRGQALTLLNRLDDARATLDRARAFVFGTPSAALESEYLFFDASWHFVGFDLERADRIALDAAAATPSYSEEIFSRGDDAYFVPLEHSVARAVLLRGLVAARKERYRAQADHIRRAITIMRGAPSPDRHILGALWMNLAFHVRDFDLIADAKDLRGLDLSDWEGDLAPMRFEILRSLGWSSALRGDHLGAFREFRRASQSAPSSAARVMAAADAVMLRRELGEVVSAAEELDHAYEIAKHVDWSNAGDQCIGLLLLAREMASLDASRAMTMFEQYRTLARALSPQYVNARDRRITGQERLTEAAIRRAQSDVRAESLYREAFEMLDDVGHRWLAATAAIELFTTNGNEHLAAYARCEAAKRPNSWLARRVAQLVPA